MRHSTGGRRSEECKTPGVFQMGIMALTLSTFMICLLVAGVCGQCTESKHPGTGTNPNLRYYYDPATKLCYPFTYNGQGGNSNNHFSEAACKCTCLHDVSACASVRPNRAGCRQELDLGHCGLRIGGWYYNVTTMRCRKAGFSCAFTIGNRFPDKRTCKSVCKGVMPPELSSLPKKCLLQKIHGKHGPDAGQRFFFDTASRTCLAFHYNGARGNMNRFDTKKDCKCTCLQTNCG